MLGVFSACLHLWRSWASLVTSMGGLGRLFWPLWAVLAALGPKSARSPSGRAIQKDAGWVPPGPGRPQLPTARNGSEHGTGASVARSEAGLRELPHGFRMAFSNALSLGFVCIYISTEGVCGFHYRSSSCFRSLLGFHAFLFDVGQDTCETLSFGVFHFFAHPHI